MVRKGSEGGGKLRAYETHGWVRKGATQTEWYGDCPFTGAKGKFYISKETLLWHSKTLGEGGNLSQFLERVSKQNQEKLKGTPLNRLSRYRKLPDRAFRMGHVGWNGIEYTIPVHNYDGDVVDIRHCRPKKRVMATAGCEVGILGHELMANSSDAVYVCEGEWDTIALRWLFWKIKHKGTVVGVPGAGIFKAAWIDSFRDRIVYVLYDNDNAGEQGELKIGESLEGVAREVWYLHWPSRLSEGFDVRDWVVNGAIERSAPKRTWSGLRRMFYNTPRTEIDEDTGPLGEDHKVKPFRSAYKKPADLQTLFDVYAKWLLLKDTGTIEICLSTVLSQDMDGDRVWMFLVGPPGSAKSEMLLALSMDPFVYHKSSITSHALISGFSQGKRDPSLIPKLDGMTLAIKDFTSILSTQDTEQKEIFGTLRDAYDGSCGKDFGNGISRQYVSSFTIIGGVTPAIYDLSARHSMLGERFLKYTVAENLQHSNEMEIIRKALTNLDQTGDMKLELQDVTQSFLSGARKRLKQNGTPKKTDTTLIELAHLSRFVARCRGTVPRDAYRQQVVLGRPTAEEPTRISIQLTRLLTALALVWGSDVAGEREYTIVRRTALSSIDQRREDVITAIYKACPEPYNTITTAEIATITRYPRTTMARLLDDLVALDIVVRTGRSNKWQHRLSDYITEAITKSRLGEVIATRERQKPILTKKRVRVRKRATVVASKTSKTKKR